MSRFPGTDRFWEIVDGGQRLCYRCVASGQERTIDQALVRPAGYRPGQEAAGAVSHEEIVCHLPALADLAPTPGDHIYTPDGRRFTVLSAQLVAAGTRWRVHARDLVLAHGLDRHVRVEILRWQRKPDGTVVGRWHTWKTGLRAAVSLWQATTGSPTRRSYERRYRVILEECPR